MAHSNNASITRTSLPTINSTPLLNDSVHCSTRNTIEKLYNSNQILASHLLCQAHSEMFKKLRNSHLAIDNKSKSKFTGLACGIKLTNPCKACWFHNNFVKLLSVYFMMTMKETKFIRALIALLLADIPKSYMKVSLLISSCKLLTLTVLRIFH